MYPPKCSHLLCRLAIALAVVLALSLPAIAAAAAPPPKPTAIDVRVAHLESQVVALQKSVKDAAGPGVLALFLCAAFCALWAQNTNRNPWLWFFLGFFFHFITVFTLLWKNAKDRKRRAVAVEETAEVEEPVCI